MKFISKAALTAAVLTSSTQASALYINGKGHFTLRGESRKNPGFTGTASHQAIDQFFRLDTEIRSGDKSSFVTELDIFENKRNSLLGDTASPKNCSPTYVVPTNTDGSPIQGDPNEASPANTGNSSDCAGRQQSTLEPGYTEYQPIIRKAYARYASELCLITAGRRDREWGLGILYDSGKDIFDTTASIFDGITCDVNLQKAQTLGFSVGYDKISETGSLGTLGTTYGPRNQSDDLDQIFFSLIYRDSKGNSSNLSTEISIFFANIIGQGELSTDVKIADLFMSFYMPELVIKQEILFRLGKTTDPNVSRIGGAVGDSAKNNLNSIAAAGYLEWILSKSGSLLGPEKYKRGSLSTHSLFLEYAYAPGDSDGYLNQFDSTGNRARDNKATAIALNQNYKPALILFNERLLDDNKRVDGIYDPFQVMNATILATGYRFSGLEDGTFTAKLINASLNSAVNAKAKEKYLGFSSLPVGYNGRDLGWELDLSYSIEYERGLELGGTLAAAAPGKALDTKNTGKPKEQLMIQSFMSFNF